MPNAQYRYYVFFTPLATSTMYGDEIDVSDKIDVDGVGSIKRSIDAGDYDVGVFTFNELEIKGFNYNGYFNDENDFRSIFRAGRDRCKVRIVFKRIEAVRNGLGTILSEVETDTITFRGLLNDEATRLDFVTESISFTILSSDSVLRTTNVPSGLVNSGMSTTEALYNILNQPKITAVLGLDIADINPPTELFIDDSTVFEQKSVKEALDELLLATNAVLLIENESIIIQNRNENMADALQLFGKSDEQGRENIIDITAYNTGRHRMFTSCMVNTTEVQNFAFVVGFGYRRKDISLDWITDELKQMTIAAALVEEFKFPKIELAVKVATDIAKDVQLLDPVSINYPLRIKPIENTFLPIVGLAEIGDDETPLPYTFGAIDIVPRISFKVIEIEENPNEFTSILRLRQTGTGFSDGVFDRPGNCIIDFAVVGEAKICVGGNDCDTYNPSVIGAAVVDCTEIA